MIDLHAHFLPNIDDGAKSVNESLKMLSAESSQGVSACVATSHCTVHKEEDILSFLERRQNSLSILMETMEKDTQVFPRIFLGAEVYLDNNISVFPSIKKLCIADTDFMLIEFPTYKFDIHFIDWVYALKLKGINPIIAHIDRYDAWKKMMAELDGLNLLYQINSSNFLGFHGRKLIKNIIKHENFYIISSDMHNTTYRPCTMQAAYVKAKKFLPDIVDDLFHNNALEILTSGNMKINVPSI